MTAAAEFYATATRAPRPRRRATVSHDEWVQAALDARVEQGFSVGIEDPATLDFLADVLGSAGRQKSTPER